MFSTKFFPTILIVIDLLAAFVYLHAGDIRRVIYWIACAILTTTVTY